MADNYLERKMEEHRNGAAHKIVRKVAASGNMPGVWQVPFAMRRVLIAGAGTALDTMLIEQLRSVGCKVAFMGGDNSRGTELARSAGAQYHPVSYDDAEALAKSVALVCRGWGDIDVVISTTDSFPDPIAEAWSNYRLNKPYPNEYGGRIIAINSAAMPDESVLESLRAYNIQQVRVIADTNEAAVASAMLAINYRQFSVSF